MAVTPASDALAMPSFRQIRDFRDRLGKANPELGDLSVNDLSQVLNQATGSDAFDAGVGGFKNLLRGASAGVDDALQKTGLPKIAGNVIGAIGRPFGLEDLGRQIGEATPRGIVDFLPMLFGGGFAKAGIAGASALTGLNVFEKTNDPLTSGLTGAATAVMPFVANKVGSAALGKFGKGVEGPGGRLIGERLRDRLIDYAGANAGAIGVYEASSAADAILHGRLPDNPFSKEKIFEAIAGNVPFAAIDLPRLVRTPESVQLKKDAETRIKEVESEQKAVEEQTVFEDETGAEFLSDEERALVDEVEGLEIVEMDGLSREVVEEVETETPEGVGARELARLEERKRMLEGRMRAAQEGTGTGDADEVGRLNSLLLEVNRELADSAGAVVYDDVVVHEALEAEPNSVAEATGQIRELNAQDEAQFGAEGELLFDVERHFQEVNAGLGGSELAPTVAELLQDSAQEVVLPPRKVTKPVLEANRETVKDVYQTQHEEIVASVQKVKNRKKAKIERKQRAGQEKVKGQEADVRAMERVNRTWAEWPEALQNSYIELLTLEGQSGKQGQGRTVVRDISNLFGKFVETNKDNLAEADASRVIAKARGYIEAGKTDVRLETVVDGEVYATREEAQDRAEVLGNDELEFKVRESDKGEFKLYALRRPEVFSADAETGSGLYDQYVTERGDGGWDRGEAGAVLDRAIENVSRDERFSEPTRLRSMAMLELHGDGILTPTSLRSALKGTKGEFKDFAEAKEWLKGGEAREVITKVLDDARFLKAGDGEFTVGPAQPLFDSVVDFGQRLYEELGFKPSEARARGRELGRLAARFEVSEGIGLGELINAPGSKSRVFGASSERLNAVYLGLVRSVGDRARAQMLPFTLAHELYHATENLYGSADLKPHQTRAINEVKSYLEDASTQERLASVKEAWNALPREMRSNQELKGLVFSPRSIADAAETRANIAAMGLMASIKNPKGFREFVMYLPQAVGDFFKTIVDVSWQMAQGLGRVFGAQDNRFLDGQTMREVKDGLKEFQGNLETFNRDAKWLNDQESLFARLETITPEGFDEARRQAHNGAVKPEDGDFRLVRDMMELNPPKSLSGKALRTLSNWIEPIHQFVMRHPHLKDLGFLTASAQIDIRSNQGRVRQRLMFKPENGKFVEAHDFEHLRPILQKGDVGDAFGALQAKQNELGRRLDGSDAEAQQIIGRLSAEDQTLINHANKQLLAINGDVRKILDDGGRRNQATDLGYAVMRGVPGMKAPDAFKVGQQLVSAEYMAQAQGDLQLAGKLRAAALQAVDNPELIGQIMQEANGRMAAHLKNLQKFDEDAAWRTHSHQFIDTSLVNEFDPMYREQIAAELRVREAMTSADKTQGNRTLQEHLNWADAVIGGVAKTFVKKQQRLNLADPDVAATPDLASQVSQSIDNWMTPDPRAGQLVTQANFLYFMGMNLSSHVLEAFQSLFSVVPNLVAQGAGYREAYKAVFGNAAKAISWPLRRKATDGSQSALNEAAKKSFGGDLELARALHRHDTNTGEGDFGIYSETVDPDLRAAHNIRQFDDISRDVSVKDMFTKPLGHFSNFSSRIYSHFTKFNARIAFMSAFQQKRKQILEATGQKKLNSAQFEQAYQAAQQFNYVANFSGGRSARPSQWFASGKWRSISAATASLQSYVWGMYGTYARFMQHGWGKNNVGTQLSAGERKNARRAAKVMFATQVAAAGALGLPVGTLLALLEMDEDIEANRAVREVLAEIGTATGMGSAFSDIALRGVGQMLPLANKVDFGSRFALGGILGTDSYDGFSAEGLAGPTAGLLKNIATSVGNITDAKYGEAFQNVMPVGFQKMFELVRNKGQFRDNNGALFYAPDSVERLAYAIGFQPAELAQRRDARRIQQRAEQADNRRRTATMDEAAGFLQDGNVQAARALLMEEAQNNEGFSVREGAANVARRVERRTLPYDPRRGGSRSSAAAERSYLATLPQDSTTSELARLQVRTIAEYQMGTRQMPTPDPREIMVARYVDQVMAQDPGLSRHIAKARVETMLNPAREQSRLSFF